MRGSYSNFSKKSGVKSWEKKGREKKRYYRVPVLVFNKFHFSVGYLGVIESTKKIVRLDSVNTESRQILTLLDDYQHQQETVRKETILMYQNIPDFFIPCFSFWTFFRNKTTLM